MLLTAAMKGFGKEGSVAADAAALRRLSPSGKAQGEHHGDHCPVQRPRYGPHIPRSDQFMISQFTSSPCWTAGFCASNLIGRLH